MRSLEDRLNELETAYAELQSEVRELRARQRGEIPPRPPVPLSRRDLLLGAGAVAGVAAAGALGRTSSPALAANGQAVIAGQTTTDTASTTISGSVLTGPALLASNSFSGTFDNYADAFQAYVFGAGLAAVYGRNDASGGAGVYGYSSGGTGIEGFSSTGYAGLLSGGKAPLRLVPATTAGPPPTLSGTSYDQGAIWVDAHGAVWVCTASGNPGTWLPLQPGGTPMLLTKVSTQQYDLANNNGSTWVDMDATNLALSITPAFDCAALISGNADLWTNTAGINQDMGVFISGGSFGAGQIVAWKESGGAAAMSPNAAFVQVVSSLVAGTAYTVKLQWKANKSNTATIAAGAGPINGSFSPTRLTALLMITP